ncbi:single-stranded DNA cytosine deaminase-like isoform X2 [Syngnathus scovelli]|uniref:single-stranded DNA cytosine deaminase-like isoform X2 n=1 Tax=Syngnathus scovelli TaxID=161590 RepID=UPI0021107788|nr:single-stranded DNA cytosine deaminase-like isoform X2 [Syngnathus scovelli]
MAELGNILEKATFLNQFENKRYAPIRETYLCFEANVDLAKPVWYSNQQGVHAETRFLENLTTLDDGRSYTVTCYLSWSPCADCSEALVEFVRDNRNVNLRIFVSRLYYIDEERNREGLRLLNDAGVHLEVMNYEHFEYCWETFVDHKQSPFPSWDDIVENYAYFQEELTNILQEERGTVNQSTVQDSKKRAIMPPATSSAN